MGVTKPCGACSSTAGKRRARCLERARAVVAMSRWTDVRVEGGSGSGRVADARCLYQAAGARLELWMQRSADSRAAKLVGSLWCGYMPGWYGESMGG